MISIYPPEYQRGWDTNSKKWKVFCISALLGGKIRCRAAFLFDFLLKGNFSKTETFQPREQSLNRV